MHGDNNNIKKKKSHTIIRSLTKALKKKLVSYSVLLLLQE